MSSILIPFYPETLLSNLPWFYILYLKYGRSPRSSLTPDAVGTFAPGLRGPDDTGSEPC